MTPTLAALAVVMLAHRFRPWPERQRPTVSGNQSGGSSGSGRVVRSAAAVVAAGRRRHAARVGITAQVVAGWCGDLARAVRSGDALRAALMQTVPADDQLQTATDPLRLGLSRGRSIAEVAEPDRHRVDGSRSDRDGGVSDHLELALSVVAVCGRLGGSAAAPLDRVAAALRQRAADDQERAAQAAQARLSAHVLTLLPVGVLVLLTFADGEVRAALASPAGAMCVGVGAVLNVTGWFWMRRIVWRADS